MTLCVSRVRAREVALRTALALLNGSVIAGLAESRAQEVHGPAPSNRPVATAGSQSSDPAPGAGGVRTGDGDASSVAPSVAPPFTLPDLRGSMVASSYGSRPVTIVHFWASWCVPCMREIPDLNRFAAVYEPRGAAFYAVALSSGSAGEVRQIARAYEIRHTVLVGDGATARAFGGISSFPTVFVVDRTGQIVGRYIGSTEEIRRRVEADVQALLRAEIERPGGK